jgi:predicted PhzF superfamily epimerase YddE/YHI9
LLAEFPNDEWMQRMAREMNLSETAFLVRQDDRFSLRWFTPKVEVELCGHATLASAHFLWESGELGPKELALFQTASGPLNAKRLGAWIEMDFPSAPAAPVDPSPMLIDALGAVPLYVGRSRFDFLVEVESEDEVRNLEPDLGRLANETERGVIVTSRSDRPEFDFVSRFFAPGVGVDEDPVTGSAHCCLGPYWSERLGIEELTGYQASERGGVVRMRPRGDRIGIGGQAVTVFRAELSAVL